MDDEPTIQLVVAAKVFGEFLAEYSSVHAAWKQECPEEYAITTEWKNAPRPQFLARVMPALHRMHDAKEALCLAARKLYDGAETMYQPMKEKEK